MVGESGRKGGKQQVKVRNLPPPEGDRGVPRQLLDQNYPLHRRRLPARPFATDDLKHHRPQVKKGRKSVRLFPADKTQEKSELLQLVGELQNHETMEDVQRHCKAGSRMNSTVALRRFLG